MNGRCGSADLFLFVWVGVEDGDPYPLVHVWRMLLAKKTPPQLGCSMAVVLSCALVRISFKLFIDFCEYSKAPRGDEALPFRGIVNLRSYLFHHGEGQADICTHALGTAAKHHPDTADRHAVSHLCISCVSPCLWSAKMSTNVCGKLALLM